jgi:hypothetical protein
MLTARIDRGNLAEAYDRYRREVQRRIERASLLATDAGRRAAVATTRQQMAGAGLGRLGNALASSSDLSKNRGVHRGGGDRFSASGAVYVRSGSDRSRGAVEAYTGGADIRPTRGRWLWIPTDALPRLAGSRRTGGGKRMSPAEYQAQGLSQKIGPLILIRGIDGRPMLAVENVSQAIEGRPRTRALLKSGKPGKNRRTRQIVILFVGIPSTSRAARIDAGAIMKVEAGRLAERFHAAVRRV